MAVEVLGVERRRRWTDAAKLEILPEPSAALGSDIGAGGAPEITILLRNGRQLRCRETISGQVLSHFLHVLEAS